MKNRVVLLAIFLFGIYCSHNRVVIDNPKLEKLDRVERNEYFYLWGMIGNQLTVAEICGEKNTILEVHSYMRVYQWLVTLVTVGIVHPLTLEIDCAKLKHEG
ncbi:MAG: hypothetical protein KBF93_20325 [Leptospiraceae bacterium]|nr:hypothetical protein [Leptospiraceae bacterium]